MSDAHWNDDDLINRLYGVGPADDHVERCADCGRRWSEMLARRGKILEAPAVPEALLSAQRRAILGRMRAPEERRAWRMVPSFAAAALLVVAIGINTPAPKPVPAIASSDAQFSNDAQFFNDIFSSISGAAPRAVAPVEGLFEVDR